MMDLIPSILESDLHTVLKIKTNKQIIYVSLIFEKSLSSMCYRIKDELQMYDQIKEINVGYLLLHYSAKVR